jgi:hypothetical protein
MSTRRSPLLSSLLAIAAMSMGASGGAMQAPKPARSRASARIVGGNVTISGRGPGWSVAQVKRMAAKRRNVQRSRRAHRGKAAR